MKNAFWCLFCVFYSLLNKDISLFFIALILFCVVAVVEEILIKTARYVNYSAILFNKKCVLQVLGHVAARGIVLNHIIEQDKPATEALIEYKDFIKNNK